MAASNSATKSPIGWRDRLDLLALPLQFSVRFLKLGFPQLAHTNAAIQITATVAALTGAAIVSTELWSRLQPTFVWPGSKAGEVSQ